MTAFAFMYTDHHALAVDVAYLQVAQLGTPHPGRVESHQHGAMKEIARRVDQACHLLRTKDLWKPPAAFWHRQILQQKVLFQRFHVEEAQAGHVLLYGAGVQFPLPEQIRRIFPDLVRAELIRRFVVVFGEIPDDPDVLFRGTLSVITTLSLWAQGPAKPHENELTSYRLGMARSRTQWRS
jgi:hypothetical protein